MPISPKPPRAAKTNSLLSCHSGRAFPHKRTGRLRGGAPSGAGDIQRSAASIASSSARSRETAIGRPRQALRRRLRVRPARVVDPHDRPESRRRARARRRESRQIPRPAPRGRSASSNRAARRSKRSRGADRAAAVGACSDRGRIPDAFRRVGAVHADPDDAGDARGREASRPRPAVRRISRRPITRSFGHLSRASPAPRSSAARDERDAGDEAELRRARLGARVDQERARVEIALGRHPAPARVARGRPLCSPATIHKRPGSPAKARRRASSLVKSTVSRRSTRQPGRRGPPRGADAQNSVCAAAIAALVSSEGANTKTMTSSAASASTLRRRGPAGRTPRPARRSTSA